MPFYNLMNSAEPSAEHSEQLNILHLPKEIVLHIFSYFTAKELCENVAPVCTLWAEYSAIPLLWRNKNYTIDAKHPVKQHISILNIAPAFHQLRLAEDVNIQHLLPLLISNCHSIQDLVVSGSSINSHDFSQIARKYQETIHSLTLEGMELDTSWYSAISCLARGLKSLTLNADCCVWALGLLAVECPVLSSVRLTSCNLTEDHHRQTNGVKRMLLLLPDNLEVLHLGAYITPTSDIVQAIGKKPRLNTLILEDCCQIVDADLYHLFCLKLLTSLQLWRAHKVTSNGLYHFMCHGNFFYLKCLDLFDCPNLDDRVLQEICVKCPQLETLDVSRCYLLTDFGISSIFYGCSHLHTFKMSHLPQPTGQGYLENLPQLLPKLVYLDAYNCFNIPRSVLASLDNSKLIVMYGKHYQSVN